MSTFAIRAATSCFPACAAGARPRSVPPRAGVASWLAAVLPVVTLLIAGCGGCGDDDRTAPGSLAQIAAIKKRMAEEAEAGKRANEEAKRQKAEAAKNRAAAPAPAPPATRAPAPPKPPVRPEQIADWKAEDYLTARRDRDPRLLNAIEQLPSRDAPEVLPALIRRAEPGKPPADRKMIQAGINAMTRAPDHGRAILESILRGQFATDDDVCAMDCALTAFLAQAFDDKEAFLLSVLADDSPDAPTTAARKKRILAVAAAGGSEDLRLKLAQMVLESRTPGGLRQEYFRVLAEPKVENLAAQTELYRSPTLPKTDRDVVEENLLRFAAGGLAQAMGLNDPASAVGDNPPKSPSQPPAMPSEVDLARPAIRQLWTESFQAEIGRRLFRLESLEQQPRLIAIAATLPTTAMRTQLCETLKRNWQDGPASLQRVVGGCEPGFLAVVKTLPRRGSTGNNANGYGATARSTAATARDRAQQTQARQTIDRLATDWHRFSNSLMSSVMKRLAAGEERAGAGAPDAQNADATEGLSRCPIKLHPGARVVVCRELRWPDGFVAGEGGYRPDGLEVYYIRTHETTRNVKAILAHYRRALGTPQEQVLDGGKAIWLDTLGPGRDDVHCRSVDVVLGRSKPVALTAADAEEKISVDLLTVEVANITPALPGRERRPLAMRGR